jgi:hypothetical protein
MDEVWDEVWNIWEALSGEYPKRTDWDRLVQVLKSLPEGERRDVQLEAAAQFGVDRGWKDPIAV